MPRNERAHRQVIWGIQFDAILELLRFSYENVSFCRELFGAHEISIDNIRTPTIIRKLSVSQAGANELVKFPDKRTRNFLNQIVYCVAPLPSPVKKFPTHQFSQFQFELLVVDYKESERVDLAGFSRAIAKAMSFSTTTFWTVDVHRAHNGQ